MGGDVLDDASRHSQSRFQGFGQLFGWNFSNSAMMARIFILF